MKLLEGKERRAYIKLGTPEKEKHSCFQAVLDRSFARGAASTLSYAVSDDGSFDIAGNGSSNL
jgi:hypothetical protein